MKRLIRILTLCTALLLTGAPTAICAPRGWELQRTERSDANSVAKWSELEIKTIRGAVIVHNTQRVQIKIFTILGQLVSNETLAPGIWQINLPAHGVYIIKTPEATCKVAV